MSKNTTKKNNAIVEWPTDTHFTIEDMFKKYPEFVQITLRFRVKRAVEMGDISVIGKIKPAIGRPRLVFAKGTASQSLLATAKKAGVLPITDGNKTETSTISVVDVAQPKAQSTTTDAATVVPTSVPVSVTA